jgi:hypothetical protein
VFSNDALDFIGICCDIPFFISNFINFDPFSLPLVRFAYGLSILLMFLKNKLSLSLILCIVFWVFISLILSASEIVIISFYLLLLGLACSFCLFVCF